MRDASTHHYLNKSYVLLLLLLSLGRTWMWPKCKQGLE